MAKLSEQDIVLRNQIAERLRQLREKTGVIQSDFAADNHMDRQLMSTWESTNNNRGMTIYTINRLCRIMKISLKDFFDSKIFEENK